MSEAARDLATREMHNVVQADAGSIMEVISRAASDPNTDVEKLERLWSMYERISAMQAERAFNEAMQAAQQEMPQVLRDAKNETTRSTYARLETVSKAMNPVITKHGFSMSYGTDNSPMEGHYRIVCTVSHTGGHSRTYHADIPADMTGMKGTQNKTATHGFGSTMSYGRRYLKLMIWDVATTDDDGNAAGGMEYVTDEQLQRIEEVIAEVGADRAKFCGWLKVDNLASLPASKFEMAMRALNAKRGQS